MHRFAYLGLALIACSCFDARAATFVVTRQDDPAPNGCNPGDCSLREAVNAANSNSALGPRDIIQLAGVTYTLTAGVLSVDQDIEIAGAGSANTQVLTNDELIFTHTDGVAYYIHGLTMQPQGSQIRGSLELDDVIVPAGGGDIFVGYSGDFTVSVEIRNSILRTGLQFGQKFGTCSITDSELQSLTVHSNPPGPAITLLRMTMDGAVSNAYSGLDLWSASAITIEDSVIANTQFGLQYNSDDGHVPDQVSLRAVSYHGNKGPVLFYNPAVITIADSDFRDNVTSSQSYHPDAPAAIWASYGSDWTISGSTFASNTGAGDAGGAVRVEGGAHVLIENSTFSGNSFTAEAAAAHARGAAIGYRDDASITRVILRHVTIAAPTISAAGIFGTAVGGFGGESGLTLSLQNSILRGNCFLEAGAMDANVGNVESGGDTCDFGAGNLVNVSSADLALGSLSDHGGPTETYLPGATSAALGAADPGLCTPRDQRGYQRPYPDAEAGCDAGSVERGAEERIFADGFD